MSDIYLGLLLVCVCAGILSELITIAIPYKILGITEQEPEKLLKKRLYKVLFTLSGLYILSIVLLLFSGYERFRIYAFVILVLSLNGWVFRGTLKKHTYIVVIESTINLILLIDVVRTVIKEIVL